MPPLPPSPEEKLRYQLSLKWQDQKQQNSSPDTCEMNVADALTEREEEEKEAKTKCLKLQDYHYLDRDPE